VDLKLDHHSKDGIEIVDVEGEIDVYTAPRLRELLIELVNSRFYQLVVNMEKVEFLDWARRPGRRAQAGPRSRRVPGPGVHAGAHTQDFPDHRPHQGLRYPRHSR
jgi:hypothetical protein